MKTDELRDKLEPLFSLHRQTYGPGSPYRNDADQRATAIAARTICETLGITREMADHAQAVASAFSADGFADVTKRLQQPVADALTALLDLGDE